MLSLLLTLLTVQSPVAPPAPAGAEAPQYSIPPVSLFETGHVARILDALGVRGGVVIADWGAGMGRFTRAIAPNVGETGRVLAIDISPSAINSLHRAVEAGRLPRSVEPVLCPPEGPDLPPGSLDAVLMVDSYHEIAPLAAVMANVRASLKPGGRLVVVDKWRASASGQSREDQVRRHVLSVETAKEEIAGFGFRILDADPDMHRDERDESLPVWMIVAEPLPERGRAQ